MHRKRMKRYELAKNICVAVGSMAFLSLVGAAGGYETGNMTTLQAIAEMVISAAALTGAWITYRVVDRRRQEFLRRRIERRRQLQQEMKKSA